MRFITFLTLPLLASTLPAQQQDSTRGRPPQALPAMSVVDSAARADYLRRLSQSAMKTPTLVRDIPQALTPISKELIADLRLQGMADVVRFVPGVSMAQGEGHRDQPSIRGNSTTADFYVDGMRDDAQYFRDLYNVDRVESIRGANAMIFGRGGGGGVINRVSKEAFWRNAREFSLEGGDHDHKRAALDLNGFRGLAAGRLNAMYQNSGMFREGVRVRRYGVNPTARIRAGASVLSASYEYFDDYRTVDRGIPSFRGSPAPAPTSVFFGQRDSSHATTRVNAGTVVLDHAFGEHVTLRSQGRAARYDKFYQNVFAGAVDASGANVSLAGYNNGTDRLNLFNQTDLTVLASTGRVRHTVVTGIEVGRQRSDNRRNTAYFNDATTTMSASFDSPTVSTMVRFRPSATDADNHVVARTASVYAQDQVELTRYLQLVAGVRVERFTLDYHNNRDSTDLSRSDELFSPRAGIVVKPVPTVSFYGTVSTSHLPASGDQFSSLNATTSTLEPEAFTNREAGVKWDAARGLSLSGAVFRLDRTNTTARDPNDPSKTVLTGEQRTTGLELSALGDVTSRWSIALAHSTLRARIVSATRAAPAGATVPMVPRNRVSVWNKYVLSGGWATGLAVVHQTRTYAAIDNSVVLPAFTHVDWAVFLPVIHSVAPQVNIENILNTRYYSAANGNNNISFGAPRTVRIAMTTRF